MFAPVARFGTIRSLIALGVQRNMSIHQMDVSTAFLNGVLKEDIYMEQPDGYKVKGKEHLVCKLQKSLYGLKQSPRCWYEELSTHLIHTGYTQSKADPCVFFLWKEGKLTVVSIYVDDLILLADLMKSMMDLKDSLSGRFKMKDMGELGFCLGIGVKHGSNFVQLQQRQYIKNLLDRFNMSEAYPVATPADSGVTLTAADESSKLADQRLYQQIVGNTQREVLVQIFPSS